MSRKWAWGNTKERKLPGKRVLQSREEKDNVKLEETEGERQRGVEIRCEALGADVSHQGP